MDIIKTRKKIAARLMYAFRYHVLADRYRRMILQEGLLGGEPTIAYTFWNKAYTLS